MIATKENSLNDQQQQQKQPQQLLISTVDVQVYVYNKQSPIYTSTELIGP